MVSDQTKAFGYHRPVLLDQTIDALGIRSDGIYLDGTAGGGGHSHAIASRLTTGRLIALDQDPDAIAEAGRRLDGLPATLVQTNLMDLDRALDKLGSDKVDGILLDIGVSAHQLDAPERGFSYHHDAPLDMRMSQNGTTAADLVATLSEKELADIFWRFGEEKFSRPIARTIVRERDKYPIKTTLQLAELVSASVPAAARRGGPPAGRVFQALRIAVTGELDCLSAALDTAFDRLNEGGRLAIITFHSLEDAMVKNRFVAWRQGCSCPKEFPVCVCGRTPAAQLVLKIPATATPKELEDNPRSRSAKLRCIEKIHDRNTD